MARKHGFWRVVPRGFPTAALSQGVGASPITILGSSLLAWWTADRADLITLSGAAVTSWKDVVVGYDAVQAVSAARPAYSATSFNGSPGITFDGVDDELTCTSASLLLSLPDGAEDGELWAVADFTALPADTTERVSLSYGDITNAGRRLARFVSGGVNRGILRTGTGVSNVQTTDPVVDLSGCRVQRGRFGATTTAQQIDSTLGADIAAVPATTNSRLRIGANSLSAPGSFHKGVVREVFATAGPLSVAQIAALTSYAIARKGS